MGRDYDTAIIVGGFPGFMQGAVATLTTMQKQKGRTRMRPFVPFALESVTRSSPDPSVPGTAFRPVSP